MITSTMMAFPLTLAHILGRAGKLFAQSEIVSRLPDKSLHRYRYGDFHRRALALGGALQALGLKRGDRVATLMWNHYAHLEAYFAVPCAGGVLHTLNLRLHPDDITYIAHHAGDRFLIVDDVLLPLYDKFRALTKFEKVIVVPLSGSSVSAHYGDYEVLIAQSAPLNPPAMDEEDPAGMFGLIVVHGWGMTETSPVGTVNYPKSETKDFPPDRQYELRAKQGVPLPFFENGSVRSISKMR